jgi:hypothetical protein
VDLISCHETLRLLPAACSPRSVVLDEVRRTFLSEIRIPATGRAAVGRIDRLPPKEMFQCAF